MAATCVSRSVREQLRLVPDDLDILPGGMEHFHHPSSAISCRTGEDRDPASAFRPQRLRRRWPSGDAEQEKVLLGELVSTVTKGLRARRSQGIGQSRSW